MRQPTITRSLILQRVVLLCLFLICILLLCAGLSRGVWNHGVRNHPVHIPKSTIEAWLKTRCCFVPANSSDIKYVGRWSSSANRPQRYGSLPGSRISFDVYNTTTVYLSLDNIKPAEHHEDSRLSPLDPHYEAYHQCLYPPSILVAVNERTSLFNHTAQGVTLVHQDLDVVQIYHVRIVVLQSSLCAHFELGFNGIWLSRGGYLKRRQSLGMSVRSITNSSFSSCGSDPVKYDTLSSSTNGVIEMYGSSFNIGSGQNWPVASLPEYLEQNPIVRFDTFAMAVPDFLCLSPHCGHPKLPVSFASAKDIYFNSGPVGGLYRYNRWSYSRQPYPPSALILEVGFWDFYTFFSDPDHHNRADVKAFTARFVEDYGNFIATVRRNFPKEPHRKSSAERQDDSYMYNSQSSTLPIFLLTPFFPRAYHPLLSDSLFNALSDVVTTLQQVRGDKYTRLIDTTGWLDPSDFSSVEVHRSPDIDSSSLANATKSTSTETKFNKIENLFVPAPTRDGYIKIAQLLAIHLCPHLPTSRFSSPLSLLLNQSATASKDLSLKCPFLASDRYQGNQYVPDEAAVGRLLEERKIEKIKAVLQTQ